MFIKVKSNEDNGFSIVNSDFIQHITGNQVQMADGTIFYLPDGWDNDEDDSEFQKLMIKIDPHLKALTEIKEAIANIKLIYNGHTTP